MKQAIFALTLLAANGCAAPGILKPEVSSALREAQANLAIADEAKDVFCPQGEESKRCTIMRETSGAAHNAVALAAMVEQNGINAAPLLEEFTLRLTQLWIAIQTAFGSKERGTPATVVSPPQEDVTP